MKKRVAVNSIVGGRFCGSRRTVSFGDFMVITVRVFMFESVSV